jgi:hypothetical protein
MRLMSVAENGSARKTIDSVRSDRGDIGAAAASEGGPAAPDRIFRVFTE